MKAARVDALRGQSAVEFFGLDEVPVRHEHLTMWPSEGRLTLHGRDVHLCGREFDLLRVMVLAAGHVLSRGRLYEAVWAEPLPRPDRRTVHVNVCQLRRRLAEASPDWEYIHTHIGRGYRFEPVRRSEPASSRRPT
jgi:DNA-binding response OmpR family regulator